MLEQISSWHALDLHTELSPRRTFNGGPQRNFCRYGILSLYSLDKGDTRAFSGV